MTSPFPKLIATSVVRGAQKGQSHGGVYTIDFKSQAVEQHIDWNTSEIDFAGRGWDRGLRGIEFTDDSVWIAASDELFAYTPNFDLVASYKNPYLKHCHEISREDNLLFLTSTGYDSLLVFDLNKKEFSWGLYLSRNGNQWVGQPFDPRDKAGPPFANNYHINMVHVEKSGIYFSGLKTGAVLFLDSEMHVSEFCTLPDGTHNARPFSNGVLFNDTQNDFVRYVLRNGEQKSLEVMSYDENELEATDLIANSMTRQAFGRGLCVIDDRIIVAGSSPSTVSIYDVSREKRLGSVNLTMDIRNAIHGLEVWPFS